MSRSETPTVCTDEQPPVESVNEENQSSDSIADPEMVSKASISETVVSGLTDGDVTSNQQQNTRSASPLPLRGSTSSSSSPANRGTPRSQVTSALRAHGETLTWPNDWERVDEKITANTPKFITSVNSPETISSMMAKHVVYTVKTEPTGYSVRRRYKDFQWLRDSLVQRYTGMFIPALPASTSFTTKAPITLGKTDVEGDFVKNRMSQLHMFIQQVCKIPFLRTDPSLHAFISVQSERDFKIVVENGVEKLSAYENWQNEGLDAWFASIESCSLTSVDTGRTIGDFSRQLEGIRTTLDQMERECRVTGRKAVALAKSMAALTEQTMAWQKLEHDLLDPNKNEYQNAEGGRIRVLMNQLVSGQSFWSNTVSMIPKVIARVYLTGIQYQFVQVEAFRALLQAREAASHELERAEKEKLKAFDEREKFRANPSSDQRRMSLVGFMKVKTLQDFDDNCQKKSDVVTVLFQQLERMTKALMYCEIDRFYRDRVDIINTLLGSLAAINLEVALNTNIKWTEVVATAGLDTEQFREIVGVLQQTMDDEDMFQDA